MKVDAKQKVLIAIYIEYQKDIRLVLYYLYWGMIRHGQKFCL